MRNVIFQTINDTTRKRFGRKHVCADNSEKQGEAQTLQTLGKRVERLLFAGTFVLAACFVELYFATASERLAEDRPTDSLQRLVTELEGVEPALNQLFTIKSDVSAPAVSNIPARIQNDRERTLAETRRALGLPAETRERPSGSKAVLKTETYADRVRDITNKAAIATQADASEISKLVDISMPPRALIATLREKIAVATRKPLQVWGIEMPRQLSVQYAGLDAKVPAGIIAKMLLAVLAPILIGWASSLYLTRQRELLLISKLEDYKLSFPHVLNLVPVTFERLGEPFNSAKMANPHSSANRYFALCLRVAVILLFLAPMIISLAYSGYSLAAPITGSFTITSIVCFFVSFILVLQGIGLLFQEAIILRGKEFQA